MPTGSRDSKHITKNMNGSQFRGNINIFQEHRGDIWGVVNADWTQLSSSWEDELTANVSILKRYCLYVGESFCVREEIQNLGYQTLGPTCREGKRWSVAGEKGRNLLTSATSNCSSMYTYAEMHRRIRKYASMFIHIHTTKRTNTQIQHMQDKGNSESNWKVCGYAKCTIFFYFPKVS